MKFFLAGIIQGSLSEKSIHDQSYRTRLTNLLEKHFPHSNVYDPFANHENSIEYDEETGRQVFLGHNKMCGEVDVVVAFIPEASMGTAIEIWEAFRHDRVVVSVTPLRINWAVKFLSDLIYESEAELIEAIESGEFNREIERIQDEKSMMAD